MEFGLLGSLAVWTDGNELPLDRGRHRALLAVLLMRPNELVPTATLVEELWGEQPTATSVKAVHVYVSRLRKLLGRAVLETRRPGYVFHVEPGALDVQRFEQLLEQGNRLLAEDAAGDAARLLRQALALWRGPPLADFQDDSFAQDEIGRLEELRVFAFEQRLEADLALGRAAEAVAELEALVREYPLRERLRRLLVLALYRTGRQADALAAYRDARAALDALGIEPGETLRRLEKQILVQDPGLAPRRVRLLSAALGEAVVLPGSLVPEPPFPFVGRASELVALRSLLGRAERGEGGLVLVGGEAGGGKTRLAREFAHEAAARGTLVLYGTSDAAVSTPYQSLREWLEFLLRVCDPEALQVCLGDSAEQLSRLVPELARLSVTPAPASGDAEGGRYVLQSAATELLRRVSRVQPLLLVADDVHWSDAESLLLIGRLARLAPEARLLVLAAFRDRGEELSTEFEDTLADLSRVSGVTRLTLARLTDHEVQAFVRASTHAQASPSLVSAVERLTRGTPLLLCELWRDLRESRAIEVTDGGVQLSRSIGELRGPERVRDMVQQRLSRLAAETTAMLELAAVAGQRFEFAVLAEAARLDRGGLVDAIEEAARNGMLEALPDPRPAWRFTHELVRRAVYERITGIRRAELHLRVGEALEHTHESDSARVLPELAHHFTLAAPVAGVERAVDYNLRAADAASAAASYGEAAARLSTALELGIANPGARARVQAELARVLSGSGRVSEIDALLEASLDAATGLGERGVEALALVYRHGFRRMGDPRADPEQSRAIAEQAIETLTELGDTRGLAVAGRWLALALRRQGRLAECRIAAESALEQAEASGDKDARRQVSGTLGYALCDGPAPVDEAVRRCRELLQANPNDPAANATLSRFLATLHAMAGRFEETHGQARHGESVLDAPDDHHEPPVYRTVVAEARKLAGDRAGAEHELESMWHYYRAHGAHAPDALAMLAAYELALLYCDEGRWEDAGRCLDYGCDVPVPAFFRHEAVLGLAARARVTAHRGQIAEAVTLAEHAIELAERSDMLNLRARVWLALAEVQRRADDPTKADAAVATAIRLYRAKGNVAAAAPLRAAAHASAT